MSQKTTVFHKVE